MILGVLLGVAAGALWGLIYIAPLLLPEYNPVLIALGRFIAFGVVSLPCLLFFRQELRKFTRADVIEAFRLLLSSHDLHPSRGGAARGHVHGRDPRARRDRLEHPLSA